MPDRARDPGRRPWRAHRSATARWALYLLSPLLGACSGGAASPESAPDLLQPGDHTWVLGHDGEARRYIVRIPPGSPSPAGHPVLFALHGGGGSPEAFKASAGLDEVADREGFALVFPSGTGETDDALTWNAGPDCCGYATLFDVDDVGYVEAVLRHLEAQHPLDRSRLYVTGHSNGAMMSYRLAAELPELWAGIVGVAGAMQVPAMAPAAPVPVLHVHSVDDPRAFYDGGTRDDRTFAPVDSMLVRWAGANGCPGEPQPAQELVGTGLDVGHTAILLRWSCTSAALEHWKLTGAGHPWPGHQVAPAWEAVVGPSTEIIDAASEIFAFVRRTSSR